MATTRRRICDELVRRSLCADATEAAQLLASGRVLVNGAITTSNSRQVAPKDSLHIAKSPSQFVSRGGEKLDGALEAFEIAVHGRSALDAGSSTGGFTDCLLQRGARSVLALDAGTNQLHEKLRADQRVTVMEQTNLRHVDTAALGPFDIVTADLSFISLRAVSEQLVNGLGKEGDLVVLIKPQFEATKEESSRNRGIITDPAIWQRTAETVLSALSDAGAATMGVVVSSIRGTTGNIEFLAHLRRSPALADFRLLVASAVASAEQSEDS